MKPTTILLVEDTEADEILILRALQRVGLGQDVVVVRDGQQALDWLEKAGEFGDREGPDLPAVVLLDLHLPRVSGLEVLSAIREAQATRLLPVVVLTSSDEERDLLSSYQRGCNAFVRKPLDFTAFAEAVGRLGLFWLRVNLPPTTRVHG